MLIFNKVNEKEPQIVWIYNKHNSLAKENFDMTDAYAAVLGFMKKNDEWI